jgi:RNA polymerase sigma factor (sigma-70 family)
MPPSAAASLRCMVFPCGPDANRDRLLFKLKRWGGVTMRVEPSVWGAEKLSVADLVRSAADGDSDAWNEIVRRFSAMVWAVARGHRLSAADAADVSQTTWLRLVEHLDRIEHPERIGAWLATTARHESLRVLRVASRQIPSSDDVSFEAALPTMDSPERALVTAERDRELWELISQLPTRCQLILQLLSGDEPLSYAELGAVLDMPVGSIGPTRQRCLEHLRRETASRGIYLNERCS